MKIYFLVLTFIFLGINLLGQSQKPPEFKKETWSWGILPFEGQNLSNSIQGLTIALAQQLAQPWRALPEHILSTDEISNWQKDSLKKALLDEEKNLSTLVSQRDQFFFKQEVKESDRTELQARIQTSQDRVNYLRELPTIEILIPPKMTPKLMEGAGGSLLLEPPGTNLGQAVLKLKNLDFLVTGKLSSIQDYLRLEISLWQGPNGTIIKKYEDIFSVDEAGLRIIEARKALTKFILGRDWARISVQTIPDDVEILIDGKIAGVGALEQPFRDPGEVSFVFRRIGLAPQQTLVKLKTGDDLILQPELTEKSLAKLSIITEPKGANVYLGGLWLGKTPLDVSPPPQMSLLEIKAPEKEPIVENVTNSYIPPPVWNLTPKETRLTVLEAKDKFYGTMALFTFSFISTVLLRALDGTYQKLYNAYVPEFLTTKTEQAKSRLNEAFTWQQTFQNSSYVGMALSAGLFGWMIWDLMGYIDVAEKDSR